MQGIFKARGVSMKKYALYMHGGSFNRGCEAIVRGTCKILNANKTHTYLYSGNPDEDFNSKLDLLCKINRNRKNEIKRISFKRILASMSFRLFHSYYYVYENLIRSNNSDTIALSIGGDNYCYGSFPKGLASVNKMLKKRGVKTVLWGCSIEPSLLNNENIVADLKRYNLITVRESITYSALLKDGINKNTHLFPDPAFQLDRVELPLPEGFLENNTIGINVSPLIMTFEKGDDITYKNCLNLINYIINTTKMQIALIHHVTWENNNDFEPLTKLYEQYKDTGRVIIFRDEYNCMELKGFISRCRMFIGARTHATIAAYSTCVPTLVVGYSVKAKGIAKDIFGTYENYVLPVQSLQNEDDLMKAYQWLSDREDEIRTHLKDFMPSYIEKAWMAGDEVRKLIES